MFLGEWGLDFALVVTAHMHYFGNSLVWTFWEGFGPGHNLVLIVSPPDHCHYFFRSVKGGKGHTIPVTQ